MTTGVIFSIKVSVDLFDNVGKRLTEKLSIVFFVSKSWWSENSNQRYEN